MKKQTPQKQYITYSFIYTKCKNQLLVIVVDYKNGHGILKALLWGGVSPLDTRLALWAALKDTMWPMDVSLEPRP